MPAFTLTELQFLASLAPPDPSWGGLGGMPLRFDFRDYDIRWEPEVAANLGGNYPASYSLAPYVKGAYDQGNEGSCVAFSTCGLVSVDRQIEEGAWPTFDGHLVYHDNGGTGANGVDPRTVLGYAQGEGLPILGSNSLRDHITSYAFVPQQMGVFEDTVKAAVAANQPCTLALLLPAQFGWTSSGAITSGYHQIVIIGYGTDPAMGDFWEILNSWGGAWGQKGRGRVPIAFVNQNGYQQGYAFSYTVFDKQVSPPPPPPGPILVTVAAQRGTFGGTSFSGTVNPELPSQSVLQVIATAPDGTSGRAELKIGGDPVPPPIPTLISVRAQPATVIGGQPSMGTVTLSGPAPVGGLVVALSINGPATIPSSVTVPAGAMLATFAISTAVVTANSNALISARLAGMTQQTTLVVTFESPPPPGPGPVLASVTPNRAPIGAVVTANGSGFDQESYLIFSSADGQGRRATERFAVNATALACKVPVGAITGPVHISRHSDGTESGKFPFTVGTNGGGGGTGTDLFVSPTGSDTSGDGGAAKPFPDAGESG